MHDLTSGWNIGIEKDPSNFEWDYIRDEYYGSQNQSIVDRSRCNNYITHQ